MELKTTNMREKSAGFGRIYTGVCKKGVTLTALLLICAVLFTGCGNKNNGTVDATATPAPTVTTAPTATPTELPTPTPVYTYSEQVRVDGTGQEYQAVFEAEDGVCEGANTVGTSRAGYSGTGYVTGFTQKAGNRWSYSVEIPYSQHYTVTVRAAADQYKINVLTVNGATVGDITCEGGKEFVDIVFPGVYLEAGTAEFSVTESWGWFDLDSITITNGEAIDSDFYNGVSSKLANPNSNSRTVAIMEYLVSIYGNHTLAGQYCAHNQSREVESLYKATGEYPAIRGFDFIFYSPNAGWNSMQEVPLAERWAEDGGLVTFSWHWHGSIGANAFYTADTDFRIPQARTEQDLSMMPLAEIKQLYEDGVINEAAYRLIYDIDVISTQLKRLQENNITVLWRPLHEASGGWFWWGASGADDYLWLWKLLFERQTYYHELNNLIWVWNAQDKEWYPGDDYVDIVGEDIYANSYDYSAQSAKLAQVLQYPGTKKLTALSENGVIMDPDLCIRDNAYWLYFNVWNGDFIINAAGELNEAKTSTEQLLKAYTSDLVITRDELPEFPE